MHLCPFAQQFAAKRYALVTKEREVAERSAQRVQLKKNKGLMG